jgi:uncharacterized membrane protein
MNLKLVIIFSVIFLILDLSWINFFKIIFNPMIEKIQGSKVEINAYGAILAYLVLIVAYLTIAYNEDKPDYFRGLMLGFAIYGTYEFTNLAMFTKWHPKILIIDILWGLFVSVMSLYVTDLIYVRIK